MKKVSASALALLGVILSANAQSEDLTVSKIALKSKNIESAQYFQELLDAGLISIDTEADVIRINGSVLEILSVNGWVDENFHSIYASEGGVRTERCGVAK